MPPRRLARRLLVLAGIVAGSLAFADPAAAPEADLDEVVRALRVLVEDPDWSVETERMERPVDAGGWGPVGEDAEAREILAAWREGRILRAHLGFDGEQVDVHVHRFANAASADASVRAIRRGLEALSRRVARGPGPLPESTYEDGAGPRGRLPGFRARFALPGEDRLREVGLQVFSRGTVLLLLRVEDVPALDRASQDAALAYADLFLTDPAAARKAPRPPPPAVEARGERLRLRVLDPEGKPVPRAEAAMAIEHRPRKAAVEDGVAEFRRPRGEPVRVFVWGARTHGGEPLPYAPANRPVVRPEETEVTLRLEPGVALAGRVLDARGQGVGGVRLRAEPDAALGIDVPVAALGVRHGEAVTDADGAYRIVGLAPIRYQVDVYPPGAAREVLRIRADGGDGDRRFVLPEREDVRVTVLDPASRPVEGARLWAYADAGAEGTSSGSAVTDARGVAVLEGLHAGRPYDLRVSAPEDREDLSPWEERRWPQAPTTVRLPGGWTLRGRVVGPDGKGTRAVVVRAGDRMGEVERTAADGTFSLTHLPLGPVRVTARDAEHPFRTEGDAWVEASPEAPTVTLTIGPATARRRLGLRVVDPEGRPVPRAMARVEDEAQRHGFLEIRDGLLVTEEPLEVEGPYDLEVWGAASGDGRSLGLAPVLLVARDPTIEDPVVRLEPGLAVTGRVTGAEGAGVRGVRLEAIPTDAADWLLPILGTEQHRHGWTQTGADGRFSLEGLGAQAYRIRVVPPPPHADPPWPVVAAPAEGVGIVLPRGGRLRVLDWRGSPVEDATISIRRRREGRPGSDLVLWRTTDPAGEAWVRRLAGRSDLEIDVAPPRAREDCGPLDLAPWPRGLRDLRLPRTFTLRGVVRGPEGPVWFAEIQRLPPDGDGEPEPLTRSDMQGRFERRGVPHGPCRIRAVTGGGDEPERASPWMAVGPDSGEVELRLPAGG